MPDIKSNFPLKDLNTFGIEAKARYFIKPESKESLPELAKSEVFQQNEILILGGGSNLLFTKDFGGLIIHPAIQGIDIIQETNEHVTVKVGCGVEWDELVEWTTERNLGGLENLSLIPGKVGAAPIQNIGAYGVEAGEFICEVEGFDFSTRQFKSYLRGECDFAYRNSIFKSTLRNSFLVTNVSFRLTKTKHKLNTRYGTIEKELQKFDEITIQSIRKAVINIRESKLPDPKQIGNAGSFFKNPVVDKQKSQVLIEKFPSIPAFAAADKTVKLSAAWLIDNAGCKGIQRGDAGTHALQPLVIVNKGGASGQEIVDLAMYVKEQVRRRFGIELEPEVNII